MKWVTVACLLGLVGLAAVPAAAGPLIGSFGFKVRIQPGNSKYLHQFLEKKGDQIFTFKGGERACVIVQGDRKPPMNITIKVFDEHKNLVTSDERGGDFAAAIWYPPRDGLYLIRIEIDGDVYNECYVSVK